ncbi:hypothetical protein [Dactylosporangium sp. CS-033363]|uniref:hypothetical protein n=1 Tax=Dactylosporangium sp. CS-033363 TaxID=3239935 RepID=UPI003D9060D9
MRSLAVAVLALALLTACAARDAGGRQPGVHPAWTSCEQVGTETVAGPGPLELPRLPAGFTPAAVVVCDEPVQPRADGGEDVVQRERRGTKVDALTAALRLPDQPRTTSPCTMDLPGIAWFAVLDAAGRWLRPGVATDACGKLRIEARQAVERLELTTVRTRVLREMTSSAAASTGCQMAWADMVGAVTADQGSIDYAGRPADAPKGQVRLCLYRVQPAEQGSGKPRGDFDRGGALSEERWTPLRAKLLAAGPPSPCTAHASRFALFLRPDGTGGTVYAELDGCRRLFFDTMGGGALRQGDQALAEEIERAV